MNSLTEYIKTVLNTSIKPIPISKKDLTSLPLYIVETYIFYKATFLNSDIVLIKPKDSTNISILQTYKHYNLLNTHFNKKVILILDQLIAYKRKRLIDKRINFVVLNKQLYLPEFLIDLKEYNSVEYNLNPEQLLPSAQLLVLYHILHRYPNQWKLDKHSFKEIAERFGYSTMGITKAVKNLKEHEIVDTIGNKEKIIHFKLKRSEIWSDLEQQKLFVSPVLKKVYIDELPKNKFLLHSNTSALDEYTDLSPGPQEYYAINKTDYYNLRKKEVLKNENNFEGKYCLEIWKYDPMILAENLDNDGAAVDPLSLYLSLKNNPDERIFIALDQIIDKYAAW